MVQDSFEVEAIAFAMMKKVLFVLNSRMRLDTTCEKVPTRDGYGDALFKIGGKNKRVVVLCADLSESTRVEKFATRFSKQFVELGVAEQNLVTVGSGLAAAGKIPFVSSYAAFCPGRCWEQIRTTICYNNMKVNIVGAHAGISVGPDGATHQMLEDIALMRVLPNMTVVVPCDYEQTMKATMALVDWKGPTYLRLAREKTKQITTSRTPFTIGEAQIFCEGSDVVLIGCGPVIWECLEAARKLAMVGISAMVINCHTVKPLDSKMILSAAKKCGRVVTVEEGQVAGGLGGAVCELLSLVYPVPVMRIGVKDHFGESGEPDELLHKFGLSSEYIARETRKLFK